LFCNNNQSGFSRQRRNVHIRKKPESGHPGLFWDRRNFRTLVSRISILATMVLGSYNVDKIVSKMDVVRVRTKFRLFRASALKYNNTGTSATL